MKSKVCLYCKKEFIPKDYRRKCCSYSCARYEWGKHNEPLHTWRGRRRSEENKKKISEGVKRAWADDVKREKIIKGVLEQYSKNPFLLANRLHRRNISSLEQRYINIFQELKIPIRFVGNGDLMIGRRNPDFVLDNKNILVEVYYRKHKEYLRGMSIDEWKSQRTRFFQSYGWETIYFDETESYKDIVNFKFKELGLV